MTSICCVEKSENTLTGTTREGGEKSRRLYLLRCSDGVGCKLTLPSGAASSGGTIRRKKRQDTLMVVIVPCVCVWARGCVTTAVCVGHILAVVSISHWSKMHKLLFMQMHVF